MHLFIRIKASIIQAQFQGHVKKLGLGQSMSRRGNCWDNAPQESFFGHFKDETYIKECETLEEVKREIKIYDILQLL